MLGLLMEGAEEGGVGSEFIALHGEGWALNGYAVPGLLVGGRGPVGRLCCHGDG